MKYLHIGRHLVHAFLISCHHWEYDSSCYSMFIRIFSHNLHPTSVGANVSHHSLETENILTSHTHTDTQKHEHTHTSAQRILSWIVPSRYLILHKWYHIHSNATLSHSCIFVTLLLMLRIYEMQFHLCISVYKILAFSCEADYR